MVFVLMISCTHGILNFLFAESFGDEPFVKIVAAEDEVEYAERIMN